MTSIKLKFRASSVSDKEGRLYYQVIHNRVVRQVMTDCFIRPFEWDEREERVTVPDGISEQRQRVLHNIEGELQWQRQQIEGVIHYLEENIAEFTADDVVVTFDKECRNKTSVFNFFRRQADLLREVGRHRTAAHYVQALNSLMRYRDGRDLPFDMVTPQFTLAYESWLRNQHLCRNTTSFYMRILRTIYNKAVAEGLTTDCQPFHSVYTGIDKTAKRAITKDDIIRIKHADLAHRPTLDFSRDMFLLSFYLRGIAPIDLAFLRKSDISQGKIYYTRSKTGQQMQVRIEPNIQRLLDKYADTQTQYLLPLIKKEDGTEQQQYRNSTQGINRHLKQLSAVLHLSTPLTLYVARHSWASIAQATHVPTHVISGAMGHDSEVTTQIYLASIQTSQIDEANSMIIDSL